MIPFQFDPSQAELVDFSITRGQPAKIRLTLQDGSELEVEFGVQQIMRMGNDPNSGLPAYSLTPSVIVRLVKIGEGQRKKGLGQTKTDPGNAYR